MLYYGRRCHVRSISVESEQLSKTKRYFPTPHGKPRVDDSRVISRVRVCDPVWFAVEGCAAGIWPAQDIVQPVVRWSRAGIFNRIFRELAKFSGAAQGVMIDATHFKAHGTAASLLKKGGFSSYRGDEGRREEQVARSL
jgi:transposase